MREYTTHEEEEEEVTRLMLDVVGVLLACLSAQIRLCLAMLLDRVTPRQVNKLLGLLHPR